MENWKEYFAVLFLKNKEYCIRSIKNYVYSENVIKLWQCQNWFAKFRFGDFDVKDAPRSGSPIEVDDDKIRYWSNPIGV